MFEFIKNLIVDFIYPPTCPICHEIMDERNKICDKCAEDILKNLDEKFLRMNYKKNPAPPVDKIFCIANYREGAREYLLKLKFENDLSVVPVLKNILLSVSDNAELKKFLSQADIAMFVPAHKKRLQERGFDVNDLIFKDFLSAQNISIENLLIRSKNTQKLFELNPDQRKAEMQNAFTAIENISVVDENILIADDIYTTGATTSSCAEVLKSLGANKIFVLAYSSDGD